MASSRASQRSTLVFDGDCGFCTTAVDWLEAHLPVSPPSTPFQWADLEALGLTREEASERVWLVTPRHQYGGHLALSALLRTQPGFGWRFAGNLIATPPFSLVAAVGYSLIARNRHRLPGGTPACAMPR